MPDVLEDGEGELEFRLLELFVDNLESLFLAGPELDFLEGAARGDIVLLLADGDDVVGPAAHAVAQLVLELLVESLVSEVGDAGFFSLGEFFSDVLFDLGQEFQLDFGDLFS